jgi:F420-non-reducing hydrogenase iron-sulfur subunit
MLSKMLEQFGVEKERFRLEWISAAEGAKFQHVCDDFTEQIKQLGPLNLNGGKNEHAEA